MLQCEPLLWAFQSFRHLVSRPFWASRTYTLSLKSRNIFPL